MVKNCTPNGSSFCFCLFCIQTIFLVEMLRINRHSGSKLGVSLLWCLHSPSWQTADKRAKLDSSSWGWSPALFFFFFQSKVVLLYSICRAPLYLKFICCLEELPGDSFHGYPFIMFAMSVTTHLLSFVVMWLSASCKGGNDCSCSYYTTFSFITELCRGFLCWGDHFNKRRPWEWLTELL